MKRLTELALTCLLRLLKKFLGVKNVYTKAKASGCYSSMSITSHIDEQTLITYIKKLPEHLIDELFTRLVRYEVGIETFHVAPFVYDGQKKLNMNFRNKDFNFKLFLEICGVKMRHVTELKIPKECFITAAMCKTLRIASPRLKKLDLQHVAIGNESMHILCQLAIEELNLNNTGVTDIGIRILWSPRSRTKLKLRVLKIANTQVSLHTHMEALLKLPMLEDADCNCLLLLKIPKKLFLNVCRLSVFELDGAFESVERVLEIIACEIPSATTVTLSPNGYTPKMLNILSYVKNLNYLSFKNGLFLFNFQFINCINGYCTSLTEFSLYDFKNLWFEQKTYYVFTILELFPNLEKLSFVLCEKLNDEIARILARGLQNRCLKHLFIQNCCNLGTKGIIYLLCIPTLTTLEIILSTGFKEKQICDIIRMQKKAKNNSVNLEIYEI